MDNLGKSIRSLRELEGMSLSELGRRIGRTRQAVSAYERGVIRPSIQTLERIAGVFNISVAELVYDGEEVFHVSDSMTEVEYHLLGNFRSLTPEQRATVSSLVSSMVKK